MQTIPDISISNGLPAIYVPLIFVLIVSALKDFYEDFKRKKSDNEENNKTVLVYEGGKFKKTFWKNLRVGNIIKVKKNECIFFLFTVCIYDFGTVIFFLDFPE